MCLQWCHVQRWLIDNDLPCLGCARGVAADLPAAWGCVSCQHIRPRAGAPPICGLTRAPLPAIGRCCHWRVEPTVAPAEAPARAPWLGLQALDLGQIALEQLSIPLIYGVPAAEWPLFDMPEADLPLAAPLDAARRAAIEAALAACDHGPGEFGPALRALDAALLPGGDADLPAGWRAIVRELRQIAAGDRSIS